MAKDPQRNNSGPQRPHGFDWRVLIWLAVLFALGLFVFSMLGGEPGKQISYSQFTQAVNDGRVASVTLQGQKITGRFVDEQSGQGKKQGHDDKQGQGQGQHGEQKQGHQKDQRAATGAQAGGLLGLAAGTTQGSAARKQPGPDFSTTRPDLDGLHLMALLRNNDVDISVNSAQPHWWRHLLISALPWIILIAVFVYFARRMRQRMGDSGGQGSMFGFGRSRARRHREGYTGVTMNTVAGCDNAKGDVKEIIEYLRNPAQYHQLGAQIPRGVLLMGPPGTGKTLLAKAVAGEASVPFYSISGSEFVEMFVGVGASRVRNMFKDARSEAPAIIFIDELDAIGRARGSSIMGGDNEREQTLNQILKEMDGFETDETVVVIAATNRPDVLDQALMRPGRFDRKIVVDRPQRTARLAILNVHTRNRPLADDVDLPLVARRTAGFSGAELGNLVNEASLCAGRQGKQAADMACFNSARDKIVLGSPREERLSEADKQVIAYHECGHALLAQLLPKAEPPDRITIIPRGQALGATEQNPAEERFNMAESDLRDRIGVMLGGRTAEKLIFGEVSTGAQQDLSQATGLVRKMVSEWGMSEQLGATAFPNSGAHPYTGRQSANYSEQTAQMMDAEIRRILTEIGDHAMRLLRENRAELDTLARCLLEDEVLGRNDIERALELAR